jgi:hypothetical protein
VPNLLGFQSSSGAHHSVEISDLQRLRGILEIRAPGLFLPSPDLYSWRVSDHLDISFIKVKPARVSVIQWGTPFSGEFRSTEFESGFGNLDIWVFLAVAQSIIWHLSRGDWTLTGSKVELFRASAFYQDVADLLDLVFIVYPTFGGSFCIVRSIL